MVLEYLEGKTLNALAPCKDERAVRAWLDPVMEALEEIHTQDILHRDIAPDNIMISPAGVPTLFDFGAVRSDSQMASEGGRRKSSFGLVKDGYSPLEQYTVGSHQSFAGDIYSLAATVYFSITGEEPPSAQERSASIVNGQPDALVSLESQAPEGFSRSFLRAVDKALSLAMGDRPQSVGEWRRLFTLEGGLPEKAPPLADKPFEPTQAREEGKVNRGGGKKKTLIIGGLMAAALAVMFFVSSAPQPGPESVRTLEASSAPLLQPEPQPEEAEVSYAERLASGHALRAEWQVGHSEFVTSVAFSPDGRTIASGSGDGTVGIWDSEAGEGLAFLSAPARGTMTAEGFIDSQIVKVRYFCGNSPMPLDETAIKAVMVRPDLVRFALAGEEKVEREQAALEASQMFCPL